ncbi:MULTISPECIES: hypothetical protein [unclassified Anaeromyxobacter]|uniref:hypothetical protein n=1 Tax=unclassified Anaeromyxobacter TaxID=2620896 RepID=UPI001F560F28|nr:MULTISPECIES: hypothetical protein [unclassified Anaeromyxobacter]
MRVAMPPGLHPLVRKALRALKPDPRLSYRPELDDKLLRTPRGFIQIAVAREHTERAGRLLDTFIRTVEGPDVRGRVFFADDKTMLEVDGEKFRFRFKEENATTPHRPTPEERREIAAHPHFHSVPKVDHQPTNRFALELYDPNIGYRYRARLADRKRATLEQALAEVPALLRRLVQENRDAEVERERRKREWDEQLRRETEERERLEREKASRAEYSPMLTRGAKHRYSGTTPPRCFKHADQTTKCNSAGLRGRAPSLTRWTRSSEAAACRNATPSEWCDSTSRSDETLLGHAAPCPV